ncbi:twitching motility protein PilT [Halorubellus sp. PRR65]|uniref:PIN domain-containing protein n=1 Tax=Halorubellus sp. PRR65 TaxID=3098148 RepID=UPI002B256F00|nr:twitching motility protein PilT [Halorubellus sp. PRR65]
MRVALDTSALMMPVELDVRLFDELDRVVEDAQPVVPEAVVEELRKLADGGGLEGTAASVGYDLAVERCERVDTTESYADDALVELATEGRVDAVVTNDRPLRDAVLDANVPVIALRGTNKLDITRP